jgi:hypothetical protein
VLSEKDIEWLHTQYPKLIINLEKKEIQGELDLNRMYEGYHIKNTFSIKVLLSRSPDTILPKVFETSGKLTKIAKKLKKAPIDMHINIDNSLCLVIKDREKECFTKGFTIKEFFENCIQNFLYWISYYEKKERAPWGEYAHGELGYLELLAENKITENTLLTRLKSTDIQRYMRLMSNSHCLCGSNQDISTCHPLLYHGILKLKRIPLTC